MTPKFRVRRLGGAPGRNPWRAPSPAYLVYCPTNASTSGRSTRKTPPVPPHVPLIPNDVTPAMTLLEPRKFGPPESPKQVPPVDALFDSSSYPGPVKPVLICSRCGVATMRTFSATTFAGLMRCNP